MEENKINIILNDGSKIKVKKGCKVIDIANKYQYKFDTPIVLSKVNNFYSELSDRIYENNSTIEFFDLTSQDGMKVYQRSTSLLLIAAAHNIVPDINIRINHHINGGYFCEFVDEVYLNEDVLSDIEKEMHRIVEDDLPIIKKTMYLDTALKLFEENKMYDKRSLFKYRRNPRVNIYKLDNSHDYFYGDMVPSAKYLKNFNIVPYNSGFVLQFPDEDNPLTISEFKPQPKLSSVFKESEKRARIMQVDTVGALNEVISQGNLKDLILISEALHEKNIGKIADQIAQVQNEVKVILVAGPSSSGKTTFSQRLALQLRLNGLKPHAISVDDYFVNREQSPIDEEGNYDFESLDAIDVKLFNEHMLKLLNRELVEIPSFNFVSGQREYNGNNLHLGPEDILIVEGIHGLNEKLTSSIPAENKFKIYISCLTQLNLDYHNRISTTDTRLIRRMIRDNTHRGFTPEQTLEIWPRVRRGEEKNIFPYQEEADVMFNSALIYELAALKQKIEPLLFQVKRSSPHFGEAKRILKFLEYFLSAETMAIPLNSLVREFVGESIFE